MEAKQKKILTLGLFGVFVLLNLIVKLFKITEMGLAEDDAFSVFHSQKPLGMLLDVLSKEANPPLFFVLLHFWIKAFGVGVFAVKSLPALFSVASGAVLFVFLKKHANLFTAVLASFFFLLSNLHFDFSHEIRAFSLVVFLCITSMYLFFEYLKSGRLWQLIALILVNAALPYSHYTSVLLPLFEGIILLAYIKDIPFKRWLRLGLGFVGSAVIFSPQLLTFFDVIPDDDFWLQKPTVNELWYVIIKVVGNDRYFWTLFVPFMAIPFLIILDSRIKIFKEDFSLKKALVFYGWFFFPILVCFWIAQFTPVFRLRYVLFAGPGILISVAYLLSNLRLNKWLKIAIAVAFVGLFIEQFNWSDNGIENWPKTAERVNKYKNDNTLILISAPYKIVDFTYYYDPASFSDPGVFTKPDSIYGHMRSKGVWPLSKGEDIRNPDEIKGYDNLILVQSHDIVVDKGNTLGKYLDNTYYNKCLKMGTSIEAKVSVYRDPKIPCDAYKVLSQKEVKVDNDNWVQQELEDSITNEKAIRFVKNMEDYKGSGDKREARDLFFSDSTSLKIGPDHQFSPCFVANYGSTSSLQFNAKCVRGNNEEAMVVIAAENDGKLIDRREYRLRDFMQKDNKWHNLAVRWDKKVAGNEKAEIKVYVWNPGGNPVYVDDFEVTVLK